MNELQSFRLWVVLVKFITEAKDFCVFFDGSYKYKYTVLCFI